MNILHSFRFKAIWGILIAITLFIGALFLAFIWIGMDNMYIGTNKIEIPLEYKLKSFLIIFLLLSSIILFVYSVFATIYKMRYKY